jgi:putative SOS response-associated peptidase YedK
MADGGQMVMGELWAKMEIAKRGSPELHGPYLRAEQVARRIARPHALVLLESEWPKWLGEEAAAEEELLGMLKPCADDMLKVWPVGKQVGNVKNNGAQLAAPV